MKRYKVGINFVCELISLYSGGVASNIVDSCYRWIAAIGGWPLLLCIEPSVLELVFLPPMVREEVGSYNMVLLYESQ